MPRSTQVSNADTFNFRIDPELKAEFARASEAEDKPAAQVLRELMRAYIDRRHRIAFEAEARRQSDSIARRSGDPTSDDNASLQELDRLLNEESLSGEWAA